MTVEMVDSIESPRTTGTPVPQLILHAPAVGAYIAGNSWPTYSPYVAARPDLAASGRIVSITLTSQARARCLDIESGGATDSEAPGWYRNFADWRHGKPILYTFASNVQALINTMAGAGIPRDGYLIWAAHFTLKPHICAPNVCGYPVADGTQYSDKGAENCDVSLMQDYCFGPTPPKPEDYMAIAVGELQGVPHVFVESTDGSVWYTYQKKGTTSWNGGEAGKRIAGLVPFAPKPGA